MIFLYSFLLALLGAVKLVTDRRAARLEKKFCKTAKAVDEWLREPVWRRGNANAIDPAQVAKRQYLIGQLVQKRDRLEAKYDAWEGASVRLAKAVTSLKSWKGKVVPYVLGIADVMVAFCLVDYFGLTGSVHVRDLVQEVAALVAR